MRHVVLHCINIVVYTYYLMCYFDQVNGIVSGYLDDLTADLVVGDNLTTATQLGEQHEAFTRKCMEVCVSVCLSVCLCVRVV